MGGRRVIKAVLTYPIQTGRFWSGPGPEWGTKCPPSFISKLQMLES